MGWANLGFTLQRSQTLLAAGQTGISSPPVPGKERRSCCGEILTLEPDYFELGQVIELC